MNFSEGKVRKRRKNRMLISRHYIFVTNVTKRVQVRVRATNVCHKKKHKKKHFPIRCSITPAIPIQRLPQKKKKKTTFGTTLSAYTRLTSTNSSIKKNTLSNSNIEKDKKKKSRRKKKERKRSKGK